MKINVWLVQAQSALTTADIPTARLDTLVLLEDCLQINRAQLLAHPEQTLTAEQLAQLSEQIKRRVQHEPLAYIRGKSEFYGRDFYIDHRVLEPRPESETLITLLKELAAARESIVDVGTGSGMLAITAQLELPQATLTAIDIDADCLAVAHQNAQTYAADITFLQGNLLEPLDKPATTLLCNLPYVPDDFQINQAALHEPALAIFGGPDGLDLYRTLFSQIAALAVKPKLVLTESLPPQHAELANIAGTHHYRQSKEDDFIQAFTLAQALS